MPALIYLISFLEGYTTLSVEIIALRNFTPIIGTNSISTSIILGIILLALSYGYYIGGKNSNTKDPDLLKSKIILNLSIASGYYFFLTFAFDIYVLEFFLNLFGSYFIGVLLSSIILFFIPVFLASQTIPLLSEILKGQNTGEKIGKLLFFSTVGSFFGSVFTSTVLFSLVGVAKSSIINVLILSLIGFILCLNTFQKITFKTIWCGIMCILSLWFIFSKETYSPEVIFTKSNAYHNIMIIEDKEINKRSFLQNYGYASGIDMTTKESYFEYIKEIKKNILSNNYKDVLIIGAAGFSLPHELSLNENINSVDVVDVDKSLKEISEKYFLKETLNEKINFYPESARYFLNNKVKENKKYDAIVIDIYVGKSLPAEGLTKEFYESLISLSENIFINLITDRALKTDFSARIFKTINSVFGNVYYKDVNAYTSISEKTNFVVTNKEIEGYKKYVEQKDVKIYNDDKNSIELDIFKMN